LEVTIFANRLTAQVASGKKGKKPWKAPEVKTLAEGDVDKYTIFDVIMPLPGRDVDYPGGALGERYKELILADGLDPSNWSRPQKWDTPVAPSYLY
jgi:tRNA pseudouridine13 synthase